MDLSKIKAPKEQEDLKDALGNYIYARPSTTLTSESLSKKELREQKKAAKKTAPKSKEKDLKRATLG